jgi:hypothetical protein
VAHDAVQWKTLVNMAINPSDNINGKKFLELLNDCQLIKKYSVPRS